MNALYFFLPFILVASVGIYQDTWATESYRGSDYSTVKNPDGSITWHGGLTPWIFDGTQYQPFLFTDGSSKTVETGYGSVKLNPDGTYSFYKTGKITETELFTDRIIAKYADVSNLNSWTYPSSINNDTPSLSWNGTVLASTKSAAIGILEYKYVNNDGKWKTQLEATNLSALTTKAFGFDQIIDLNRDTIKFGGITRNLDNFNNTTFDRNWIENNQSKIIDLLNDFYFDFDLGFENLYSITVIDTGANKSRLIFDYRTSTALLPGQTLVIDPTFGWSAYSTAKVVFTDQAAAGTCQTFTSTADFSVARTVGASASGDAGGRCWLAVVEDDFTSIPTGSTISSTKIRMDLTSDSGMTGCDYKALSSDIGAQTASQLATMATTGTALLSNDSTCGSTGTDVTVTLGSTANTLLATEISTGNGIWGIGITEEDYNARGAGAKTIDFAAFEWEVVYTTGSPPNPVTVLNDANLGANSVDLIWDAPTTFGAGTFQTYTVNYTTPWGDPVSFLANSTNLYYNVTGLVFGTDYSFRVAARTEIPGNNTGAYILNITTTSSTYSLPPTSLEATSALPTQINLQWVASTIDSIRGYKIEREDPIDSGWDTLVANTTNTNNYYNDTSVTTNIKYNYRVSAMNGTGFSTVSNEADSYAYHIPDAVTDLTGSATDFSTISLTWSEPDLYADLIGYRVNYTTPDGDPTTILLPNPYTTGTSASVLELTAGFNYSFRVAPVTIFGANASGNIFNATTSTFLEPGELGSGDVTNTDDFQIFFDRTDINSTAIQVDVTYSDTYDLSCDMAYQMARFNQTYSNLTETVVDTDDVSSSFVFVNATGDIINIRCWDTNTGDEAYYVLTITDFPFLDQIDNMRNGTYGTYFQIGAIDGVTLMVCVLAMIGFNRTNPIAGIFFLVVTVGVLSAFEIITYPIVMYPALALLFVWAFISTRKDD